LHLLKHMLNGQVRYVQLTLRMYIFVEFPLFGVEVRTIIEVCVLLDHSAGGSMEETFGSFKISKFL